jgi:hypothetical protein
MPWQRGLARTPHARTGEQPNAICKQIGKARTKATF